MAIIKRGVYRAEVIHFDEGPDLCYVWTSSDLIGDSFDRLVFPFNDLENVIELLYDVKEETEPVVVINNGDNV